MKIASNTLELRILRTLTSGNKQNNKIIHALNPACFNSEIGKELYERITLLAKQRGIITTWSDLQTDPAINEDTRKILQQYKKKPIKNKEQLETKVKQLNEYRKFRATFGVNDYIMGELNKKKIVNIDDIISNAIAQLQDVRIDRTEKNQYIDIGTNTKAALRIIKNLLKDSSGSFIPTGFKEFDDRNVGIPRGTFGNIQTNSGGGKSVFANQICGYVASIGLKACLVPLEMTGEENLRRHVARVTDTEMGDVNDPKRLSKPKKLAVTKEWMRWHRKIKKAKGLLRIYPPQQDMTVEEILLELEPFGFDLIVIDYLGLAKGNDGDDQAKRLGASGRFAKRYAQRNNNAVMACAQLSEDNKVRYSRALNEHSNLSFSWQYNEAAKEYRIVLVELPKARNQDAKPFYLKEAFNYMRFEAIDATEAKSKISTKENAKKDTTKNSDNSGRPAPKRRSDTKYKEEGKKRKTEEESKRKNRQIVTESDFVN